MTSLNKIDHVVVLMLENRSFDNMLGQLYPASAAFNGLTGNETNPDANGNPVKVWNNSPDKSKATMTMPDPDPGELWLDINDQIYGTPDVPSPPPAPAPMSGFVDNYLAQEEVAPGTYDAKTIMHYFMPDQVPVISTLAKQFAVCDSWYASAPCQTWPNRFFVHTGTANGYENNMPTHFPYEMTTIYNRCELAGTPWRIYFHDIAQSATLAKLLPLADHFHFFDTFEDDARTGNLPAYSFIEPRYFTFFRLPNDQHPPHDVTLGEQLIADTYNALRAGPKWTSTLLVVIYDEHGGCYDHASPPKATPPGTPATHPFNFDRYGVRVPAVLASPYIQQGTILRPPGTVPYDHTSVIATLRKRFPNLGPPLTDRDAVAPALDNVLTLANPDNLGPQKIEALPFSPTPAQLAQAQAMPVNNMQEALLHLAANLPNTAGAASGVDFQAIVANHLDQLRKFGPKPLPGAANLDHVAASAAYVREKLGDFFRGLPQP
jgi:phospholipase C